MHTINSTVADKIAEAIDKHGYIILPAIFEEDFLSELLLRAKSLKDDELKAAGIGRGDQHKNNSDIRRDRIHWLDKSNEVENKYLHWMESLRLALNQKLYLGLFDYEAHYAVYQQGDFYKKHVDSLKGASNRMLSSVFYLNENWQQDNGGELLIYSDEGDNVIEKVQPDYGTLVIFLSEQFPHEVLAANKTRYSIAGWFRVNASNSQHVDTIY